MRILITGATGFIGRALVPVLQRDGHAIVAWVRSESRARARLGADIKTVDAGAGAGALTAAIEGCDAVVNLAGEPIVAGRWSAARRKRLRDSRVGVTTDLVQALAAARRRPAVLVSGSAVGYYGNRGGEILGEGAAPGVDFLAQLCQDWEAAAREAGKLGLRVVTLRTGAVLGRDGGALAAMLPAFRLGLGGPMGSGRQYLPWIHLHDLVGIIAAAVVDDRLTGPVNGVAPEPVTNREFATALGRAIGRPAALPVPGVALRAILGKAAGVLLDSQRVDPAALRRAGFSFMFPALDAALADILGGPIVTIGALTGPVDARGSESGRQYLERRPPTRELRMTTVVNAPLDETFAFFSKAGNLGMLTPAAMRFSIDGPAPMISEGTSIAYRLRVASVPMTWRSRIVNWMPGSGFSDFQEGGPYRSWWHEHSFRASGTSTVMEDRVCYAPPLGALGRLANRLFIVPTLRRIFRYRADVIRLRFGAPPK
jgi:uncharacterized protein